MNKIVLFMRFFVAKTFVIRFFYFSVFGFQCALFSCLPGYKVLDKCNAYVTSHHTSPVLCLLSENITGLGICKGRFDFCFGLGIPETLYSKP